MSGPISQTAGAENQASTPITLHVIKEVFEEILPQKSNFKTPRHKALQELAEVIEARRQLAQLAAPSEESHKQGIDFINALTSLRESLPSWQMNCSKQKQWFSDLEQQRRLDALHDLENSIEQVKAEFFPRYKWDRIPVRDPNVIPFSKWQDHAHILVRLFKVAMASTNPDSEIHLSNDGPISKFIEAVIPMLTNEEVKGVTVIRWLSRNPE